MLPGHGTVRYHPASKTRSGWCVVTIEQLKELQGKYAREQDASKRQAILDEILALIRVRWEQLFSSLSEQKNSSQILLLIGELNRIFEDRRANSDKPDAPV